MENCGIAAVDIRDIKKAHFGGATYYLYKMLLQEQNRGQLSAGITTYDQNREELLITYKELGYVNKVFRLHHKAKHTSILKKYKGTKGIGHVRYATFGGDDIGYAQPFERIHGRKWKWFSFCFNGNIANASVLKERLKENGYHLIRESDTEILMHMIAKNNIGEKRVQLEQVFSNMSNELDGSYNIAFINAEGELAIIRDSFGFKPVVYGTNGNLFCAASESASLTTIGIMNFKSLEPGKMIIVNDNNIEEKRFAKCERCAHCMFEWVYFGNAASIIDDIPVYDVRWNLGKELAKNETENINDFIVIPVPDSSKPAADSFASELGLPCKEGLIRNRYVGRTFIESFDRSARVRDKFAINKSVTKGKKIFLIEDSIVRGTTTREIVEYIKNVGEAKEIHVRVSCPTIFYPCFYGINMSTMQELIANKFLSKEQLENRDISISVNEQIAKEISANSVIYQSIDSLVKAIGKGKGELCTACLTGEYPTEYGKILSKKALENRGKKGYKKIYC